MFTAQAGPLHILVAVRALYDFDFRLSSAKFATMTLSAKQLAHSTPRREQLIQICKTLPEVIYEVAGKEHIAFRVRKKIFAYYLFDHHGDGMIAFCCKSSLNEQRQ